MARALNFLHLTTFYPPYSFGGDAMYIYRLSHALGDAGHHVDVIHCVDSFKLLHPEEPKIKFTDHPNVNRHELRSPFKALSPLLTQQTGYPLLKSKTIKQVLSERKYDVIQFHNISLLGPAIMRVDSVGGQAVKLYMTHEHWLVCPNHVLWKFNNRACETPECLSCVLRAKRPPQLWRYTGMLDRAAAHVDRFVSPSRFTARMHSDRGFSRPVDHLPYFIDRVDDEWRNPGSRPQERPYFLFVGRLEIIKGLHTIISLLKQVPHADLLIAGSGTYEGELRRIASGNPQIRFLGPKSQRELSTLYYHALACIVPSITYETFGIIVVEAFARKTPVIVRDLGALPEVVKESRGGFIFHTDDELLDALHRLASSPSLRNELGENGYRAFLKFWCREAHMEIYFRCLREIAERKFGTVPWEMN